MIKRLEGYTGTGFQERKAFVNLHNDLNYQMNKRMIEKKENREDADKKNESTINPIFFNHRNNFNMKSVDSNFVRTVNNINPANKNNNPFK